MTRQARGGLTSLLPLWRPVGQLHGAVMSTHTINCFTMGSWRLPSSLQSIDGVCSLFLSLPWSASLSVERGERAIRPHYYQLTLEIYASTQCNIGPSLHPVQALKSCLRLICGSDLYANMYGIIWFAPVAGAVLTGILWSGGSRPTGGQRSAARWDVWYAASSAVHGRSSTEKPWYE